MKCTFGDMVQEDRSHFAVEHSSALVEPMTIFGLHVAVKPEPSD